jgi:hypothetical protein
VSTFVALLSHVAGGGAHPALIGILVPLVLSVAVCTVLAGRRLPLPRVAASVLASQALFHALFVLGTPSGVTAASGPSAGAGHVHSVVLTSTAAHTHVSGPGMWVAHAVAAAITVVALRRGELAAARLLAIGRFALAGVGAGVEAGAARFGRVLAIRPVGLPRLPSVRGTHAVAVANPVTGRSSAQSRRGPPSAVAV